MATKKPAPKAANDTPPEPVPATEAVPGDQTVPIDPETMLFLQISTTLMSYPEEVRKRIASYIHTRFVGE